MVKSFLIIIICKIFIYAQDQIILVVGEHHASKQALLSCYEDGRRIFGNIKVNVGKKGFADGEKEKKEGDNKAPLGTFSLDAVFGYKKNIKIDMPYLYASKNLICVDDPNSKFYNQIIEKPKEMPKSFELMRRNDPQYELGVVVGYNKEGVRGRGSCIFLHVQKSDNTPTAGCTSMKKEDMEKIIEWLDKGKNPVLIQTTEKELEQVLRLYPALRL